MFQLTLFQIKENMVMKLFPTVLGNSTTTTTIQEQVNNQKTFFLFREDIAPYTIVFSLIVLGLCLAIIFSLKGDKKLLRKLENQISDLMSPKAVPNLTYSEAIQYFVEQRQEHPGLFKKGAILIDKSSKGYLVTQVFIDNKNDLVCQPGGRPYGRRILANQINDELLKAFGKNNLIIVE